MKRRLTHGLMKMVWYPAIEGIITAVISQVVLMHLS